MTKEKLLKTLNEMLDLSKSTLSCHNDNYHYYKGRTDTLKELLRLEAKVEES